MNFIELFNEVAKVARPVHMEHRQIDDWDTDLDEFGLDSLDLLMCCLYLCEIYGIDEEQGKTMSAQNVRVIYDFLMLHKQKEPASIAEALESIK
jgi:acyl carrier protein